MISELLLTVVLAANFKKDFRTTLTPGALLSLPFSNRNKIYTTRSAGEGKAVYCVQNGPDDKPRVLLDSVQDPYLLKFPLDGFSVSDNNRYIAYFTPKVPLRFEDIQVLDTKTGKVLPEVISWTYYSDLAWQGDGFYYGRYPAPSDAAAPIPAPKGTQPTDHLNEKVFYHRLGTAPSSDELVYEDPAHPAQKYLYLKSFDGRFFHLHMLESFKRGSSTTEWFRKEGKRNAKFTAIQPEMLPARFFSCDDLDGKLMLFTNYKAPKSRVILVDSNNPAEPNWKTVIPEREEELTGADPSAGKLILTYKLASGGTRIELHDMKGALETTLPIPAGAEVDIQWGSAKEKNIFLSITPAKGPKTYFRYDLRSKSLIPFS